MPLMNKHMFIVFFEDNKGSLNMQNREALFIWVCSQVSEMLTFLNDSDFTTSMSLC